MWFFMVSCYLLTAVSFVLLVMTGLQGALQSYAGVSILIPHFKMALMAIILYLFTQSLIMFFFIGTGSSVKDFTKAHDIDPEPYRRTVKLKHLLFPVTMWNLTFMSIAFVLGGAVDRMGMWSWVHGLVFLLAMVHFVKTIRAQHGCFKENVAIFTDLAAATDDAAP
jgi:hypothetical protein